MGRTSSATPSCPRRAGLYRHGPTYVCVNRGAGYWGPPLRLGARSEILRIILRAPPPAQG